MSAAPQLAEATSEIAEDADAPGTPVYDVLNFRWDEPLTVTHAPPFTVPSGGAFKLTCDWSNQSDSTVFFGTSVEYEMCFFCAYYFPSRGSLVCANGLFPCNESLLFGSRFRRLGNQ
jgi:hypothetical protein